MEILEPKVEYLEDKYINTDTHIAMCARVCYGKDSGNNDEALVANLMKSKHYSVFRHRTIYAVIPITSCVGFYDLCYRYFSGCPWFTMVSDLDNYYVITNGHCYIDITNSGNYNCYYKNEYVSLCYIISMNMVNLDEFHRISKGKFSDYYRYTFKLTTQISTSRELNRVSPNNITERSTRYVKTGSIVRPYWVTEDDVKRYLDYEINHNTEAIDLGEPVLNYLYSCNESFIAYQQLINTGVHRQDARGILPLDTTTVVIYTYSYKEWQAILDLRLRDKTGKAHPNCHIIMDMLRSELFKANYKYMTKYE